jgi:arginine repressor
LKNKGAITENVDINKHLSNSGLTSAEKADISKKIKEMGLTGEGEIKKEIGDVLSNQYYSSKDLKVAQGALSAYSVAISAAKTQLIYKKLTGTPVEIDFLK